MWRHQELGCIPGAIDLMEEQVFFSLKQSIALLSSLLEIVSWEIRQIKAMCNLALEDNTKTEVVDFGPRKRHSLPLCFGYN